MAAPLPRAFQDLLAGAFISNLGDGLRMVALPLLATRLTDSPLLIGAVTAAQFLPWFLVAPVIGGLVDRSDRPRLIVGIQLARGLVLAALTIAVLADVAALWQIYLVAFLVTTGEILVDPSLVAILPTIVTGEQLDTANGRLSAVEMSTNEFLGGPLGAFLFTLAPWLPFLVDAGTYAGSTPFFGRLPSGPPRNPDPTTIRSLLADMRSALGWLFRHAFLRPWILAVAIFYIGSSAAFGLFVVLARDEIGVSERNFGWVLAAGAVGGTIGSALAGRLTERLPRGLAIPGAALMSALTLLLVAAAGGFISLSTTWFLNGLGAGALLAVGRGIQQRVTPNEMLGRVNIASRTFTRSMFIVGALLGGLVAIASVRWTFVMAGLVQIVGAAGMARALRLPDAPD